MQVYCQKVTGDVNNSFWVDKCIYNTVGWSEQCNTGTLHSTVFQDSFWAHLSFGEYARMKVSSIIKWHYKLYTNSSFTGSTILVNTPDQLMRDYESYLRDYQSQDCGVTQIQVSKSIPRRFDCAFFFYNLRAIYIIIYCYNTFILGCLLDLYAYFLRNQEPTGIIRKLSLLDNLLFKFN